MKKPSEFLIVTRIMHGVCMALLDCSLGTERIELLIVRSQMTACSQRFFFPSKGKHIPQVRGRKNVNFCLEHGGGFTTE